MALIGATLAAGQAVEASPPPNGGGTPLWSPNGRCLAFVAGTPNSPANLWAVDLGAPDPRPRQLTRLGGRCLGWAPDSRTLYYQTIQSGRGAVYSVRLSDGKATPALTFLGDDVQALAPSPRGDRVAYVRAGENGRDLWVVGWDGAGQRRLTHDLAVRTLSWSRDGKWIALDVGESFGASTFVVDAAGGTDPRLVFGGVGSYPSWSPDGSRLAILGLHSATIVGADGSGERRLHISQADSGPLSWSPDGQLLAYTAVNGARRDIAAVAVDTGKTRTLSPGWTRGAHPAWSPDGLRVAFEAVPLGAPASSIYVVNARSGHCHPVTRSWASAWSAVSAGDGKATLFLTDRWGRGQVQLAAGGDGVAPATPLLRIDTRLPIQVCWPRGASRGIVVHGAAIWELTRSAPPRQLVTTQHPTSADLSPGGDQMAYVRWQEHIPALIVRQLADGSERELLPAPPAGQGYGKVAWSPRGDQIAFAQGNVLWKVSAQGGPASVIWTPAADSPGAVLLPPAWSPDGRCIAVGRFTRVNGQHLELWLLRPATRSRACIFAAAVAAESGLSADPLARPYAWHPSGRRLAFCAELGGVPAIYMIEVGRRSARAILLREAAAYPQWSADGSSLSYTSLAGNREALASMVVPAQAAGPPAMDPPGPWRSRPR